MIRFISNLFARKRGRKQVENLVLMMEATLCKKCSQYEDGCTHEQITACTTYFTGLLDEMLQPVPEVME